MTTTSAEGSAAGHDRRRRGASRGCGGPDGSRLWRPDGRRSPSPLLPPAPPPRWRCARCNVDRADGVRCGLGQLGRRLLDGTLILRLAGSLHLVNRCRDALRCLVRHGVVPRHELLRVGGEPVCRLNCISHGAVRETGMRLETRLGTFVVGAKRVDRECVVIQQRGEPREPFRISQQAPRRGRSRQPASPLVLVAQWMMAAAAVTAGSMPWPVRRSAVKNGTACGVGRSCRASTRTSQPLSCSRATTSFPRRPVPPVTRTGEADPLRPVAVPEPERRPGLDGAHGHAWPPAIARGEVRSGWPGVAEVRVYCGQETERGHQRSVVAGAPRERFRLAPARERAAEPAACRGDRAATSGTCLTAAPRRRWCPQPWRDSQVPRGTNTALTAYAMMPL